MAVLTVSVVCVSCLLRPDGTIGSCRGLFDQLCLTLNQRHNQISGFKRLTHDAHRSNAWTYCASPEVWGCLKGQVV